MMIKWETRGRQQKLASVRPVTIRARRGALRWVLACAAMLTTPAIFALGVGDISWQSKLNEPLDATIELIYSDTTEPSSATVRLASEEDFSRVGMDRSRVRSDLTFAVERNDDGNFVIRASSESPITEPFVNFLIEVEWANGRLLREYVVLLDPPVTAPSAVEVAPLRDTAPDPVVRQPVEDTTPDSDPGRLSPADTAPTTRPSFSGADEYGPVSRGETLWEIAQQHRPDSSVSINQMMVAMLRMNPDAFYQDNVNALREGAVLRIPTRQQVDALSEAQANNEVLEFNESWNEYARVARLAQVPTVSDVGADAEFTTTSPSTSTPDTTSRLELVPPSSTSQSSSDLPGSDAQAAALRDDLSRTREDLISAQQENNELNDRVDELENLVSHLEKMVSLKDTDLAKLQEQLRQARELEASAGIDTTPPVDTSSDPFSTDTTTTSDPIASGTTSGADSDPFALPATTTDTTTDTSSAIDSDPLGTDSSLPTTTDTAPDSTTTSAVADTASAEPVTTAASTTTSDSLPSRPPEGKPWYDGLVKNWVALTGLAVALLALVGLVFYAKSRRAGQSEDDEVFELVDSADIDESQVPDLSSELGEDEDRETVLREALATDPDDPQNHLALIRRHYAADDRERFVGAAEAMRDRVGDSHPAWMEVRAMGANIASDHAMFGGAADVDENAETRMMNQTGEEDLDLKLQLNTTADDLDLDLNLDDDTDTDLDLDLGDTDSEMSLDLDLGDDELDLDLDSDGDDLNLDLDSGGDDLDLDLDLDDASGDAAEQASGDELSLDLDDDFDLDLDDVSDDATSISSNDLDLDFSLEDSAVDDDSAGSEDDDELGLDLDLDDLGSDDSDDFSLNLDDLEGAGSDDAGLDLGDLDLGDDDAESQGDLDLGDLDLDLGDDDAAAPLETDFQIEALDADELSDNAAKETRQLSLEDDLGLDDLDLGGDLDDDDDAAGTKLDLAKAYIDMGDPDGARGMLDEVLAEGTESQQSEARSLLDSL